MAYNTNVVLENSADGYVAEGKSIKGGYFVIDALANIPPALNVKGAKCYNQADGKTYIYNGFAWVRVFSGNLYKHSIRFESNNSSLTGYMVFEYISTRAGKYTRSDFETEVKALFDSEGAHVVAVASGGYYNSSTSQFNLFTHIIVSVMNINGALGKTVMAIYINQSGTYSSLFLSVFSSEFEDTVVPIF